MIILTVIYLVFTRKIAIICYKSSVRDSEGFERVTRGCTTRYEHLPLYCNPLVSSSGPKKREVLTGLGTYNIECCVGDYCNSGPFPLLPPIKTEVVSDQNNDDLIKLGFAIFGPALCFGIFAIGIILYMRRNHKKRLMEARNQQDTDMYLASDDLLKRTHACGDSTLRVGTN